MPPDLNTLPASRRRSMPPSPSQLGSRRISIGAADTSWPAPPSPRSPPLSSLHAAATINAGLHRSPSNASPSINLHPAIERRRSSLLNNLNMNDPTIPAPGELQQSSSNNTSLRSGQRSLAFPPASPPHHRHPSLGELHQELENEQEAQVNRLLHMIRIQQDQLAAFQQRQQSPLLPSTSQPSSPAPSSSAPNPNSTTILPSQILPQPYSSSSSSSPPSTATASAFPPPLSSGVDFPLPGGNPTTTTMTMRDETAFYQAETLTLIRENRMLKLRLRELERQVAELNPVSSVGSESG